MADKDKKEPEPEKVPEQDDLDEAVRKLTRDKDGNPVPIEGN